MIHPIRLCLVAALLLAATAAAQAQQHISLILHGGLNVANASLDPEIGQIDVSGATHGSRLGVAAGAGIEYGFSNLVNVQLEANYAQRGITVDYPDLNGLGPTTGSLLYEYLELPLYLKLRFGRLPLTFSVYAGPDVAVKLNATGRFTAADTAYTLGHDSFISSTDITLDAGGTVSYEIDPGISLLGDLRYLYGVKDVTLPVDRGEELWYTRDLRLMLGLRLHLWTSSSVGR